MKQWIVLFLLFPVIGYGAEKDSAAVQYASAGFSTNSTFYGRTFNLEYPSFLIDYYYYSPKGFMGAISLYDYIGTGYFSDEIDLMAGYSKKVRTGLELSASYTHYFFRDGDQPIKSMVSGSLDLEMEKTFRFLTWTPTISLMHGDGLDAFLTNEFEKEIGLYEGEKLDISLKPSFDFYMGTQYYVQTFAKKSNKGKAPKAGKPGEIVTPRFQVLNYQFYLDLATEFEHFDVEQGVSFFYPVNRLDEDPSEPGFYYSFTVSKYF